MKLEVGKYYKKEQDPFYILQIKGIEDNTIYVEYRHLPDMCIVAWWEDFGMAFQVTHDIKEFEESGYEPYELTDEQKLQTIK
jgi:hypothetical protein